MSRSDDLYSLPPDLPIPIDDGSCDHLAGLLWPAYHAIHSRSLRIAGFCQSRVVSRLLLPADGSARPGSARRSGRVGRHSRRARLYAAGMLISRSPRRTCKAWRTRSRRQHTRYGVSTRGRRRLHLPFELLSDSELELARALQLPTFSVAGQTLIKRLTLVGRGGRIEKCFYPVFPPDADGGNVLRYIG